MSFPSTALQELFQGVNVFLLHKAKTLEEIKAVHKSYLVKLHPDKLAENDLAFLKQHAAVFNALLPSSARAEHNIESLPTYFLDYQKAQYTLLFGQLSASLEAKAKESCWLCHQALTSPFVRYCKTDGSDFWYFHDACLANRGLEAAKQAYDYPHHAQPPFDMIANLLPQGYGRHQCETAWIFFLEKELDAKRLDVVLRNMFDAFALPGANDYDELLEKIVSACLHQMTTPQLLQHLVPQAEKHGKEDSTLDMFCRMYMMKQLLALSALSSKTDITHKDMFDFVDLFAKTFSFSKSYVYQTTEGGGTLLQDILKLTKAEYAPFKKFVAHLFTKYPNIEVGYVLGDQSILGKLASHDYHLATRVLHAYLLRNPDEARGLLTSREFLMRIRATVHDP